jgi:hypothetical protein
LLVAGFSLPVASCQFPLLSCHPERSEGSMYCSLAWLAFCPFGVELHQLLATSNRQLETRNQGIT